MEINQDVAENESRYYTINDFNAAFNLNNDSNQQSLSLLHINARSMNTNFDSMDLFFSSLQNFPFSIIGITETWLNNKSPPIFNIENSLCLLCNVNTSNTNFLMLSSAYYCCM